MLDTLREHLELVLPRQARELTRQVRSVLEARDVVGGVGVVALIAFSAERRHYAMSAFIPFLFLSPLGAGLLVITFISGALQAVPPALTPDRRRKHGRSTHESRR